MGKRIRSEPYPSQTQESRLSAAGTTMPRPCGASRKDKTVAESERTVSNSMSSPRKRVSSPSLVAPRNSNVEESGGEDSLPVTPPATTLFLSLGDNNEQSPEVEDELKYHLYVANESWDKLKRQLKKYDAKYYKMMRERAEQELEQAEKDGSPDDGNSPGGRKWGQSLRISLKRASIQRFRADPSEVISPLLTCDRQGRTPLHLACMRKTPGHILADLLSAERIAASMEDCSGRTPLHYAAQSGQNQLILEKIIQAYPNAMKNRDEKERTPLWFAVQSACRQSRLVKGADKNGYPFCWRTPLSEEEKGWQFHQQQQWSNVEFLLLQFVRRKRTLVSFDQNLMMQAMEFGAPPDTIRNFIIGNEKYLKAKDDFAGSAVAMCVKRQYSTDILEYLLDTCRERAPLVMGSLQNAMISYYLKGLHSYRDGTPSFCRQILDRAAHESDVREIGKEAEEAFGGLTSIEEEDSDGFHDASDSRDDVIVELSPECSAWWGRLRYLIFYSAYGATFGGKDSIQDVHLVHAALSVSISPPSLIQLLIIMYPRSRYKLCPVFKALPIHIACTRWKYDLLQVQPDRSQTHVLKQLIIGDQRQIVRRHGGRLPLHLALAVGQSWSFVRIFLRIDQKSFGIRDPITKLFPFQLAALRLQGKNLKMHLRNRNTPEQWMGYSERKKREQLMDTERTFERKQIETIFELLRRHPNAISGKVLHRKPSFEGVGPVSKHYLSLAYVQTAQGWEPFPAAIKLLRQSIVRGRIATELQSWWEALKVKIWSYSSATQLPKTQKYLLHAALYNPDTPPLIIQLLLELFPQSASIPVPQSETYPLHIAAGTIKYHPQRFEIPFSTNSLHLVLLAFDDAAYMFSNGRLPIHICIAGGKTWDEIGPLAQYAPLALHVADERSHLMPFQQMATFKATSKENALRFSLKVERHTNIVDAGHLSATDRGKLLKALYKKIDNDVLSSIFELLRTEPSVLHAFVAGSSKPVPENNRQVIEAAKDQKRELLEKFVRDMENSSSRDLLAMPFPRFYGQNLAVPTPIDELTAFSKINTSARSLISSDSFGSYL
eukprot:scaffold5768_cov128-Cylindrotheca_fusiformis.AAC.3